MKFYGEHCHCVPSKLSNPWSEMFAGGVALAAKAASTPQAFTGAPDWQRLSTVRAASTRSVMSLSSLGEDNAIGSITVVLSVSTTPFSTVTLSFLATVALVEVATLKQVILNEMQKQIKYDTHNLVRGPHTGPDTFLVFPARFYRSPLLLFAYLETRSALLLINTATSPSGAAR
jgi:hypothetical protein